jgi:hypothetical protein
MVRNWRDILRNLIVTNPAVKMDIMTQLRVSERSPERWIAGDHDPTSANVRGLARMFPELKEGLCTEFPKAFNIDVQEVPRFRIPGAFYGEVVTALAHANPRIGKPAMIGSVLTQMVAQLDPENRGLLILFAQCILEDDRVSSMQISEDMGVGTGQWSEHVIPHPSRIGAGSLAAAAVSQCRAAYWPIDGYPEPAPYVLNPHVPQSSVAFPVVRHGGRVAGALFLASTKEDFFTQVKRDIISKYTDLFALAFPEREFYSLEQIDLETEPSAEYQKKMHQFFRSYVHDLAVAHPELDRKQVEDLAIALLRERKLRGDTVMQGGTHG